MYEFNSENNDQKNIPKEILQATRKITCGTHVIDVGSGIQSSMHIDFQGADHTRIDKNGVVCSPTFGVVADLEEAICITPANTPIFIVMFRSFSCFDNKTLENLRNSYFRNRQAIAGIILYDYAINSQKIEEYGITSNCVGRVLVKRAEWYPMDFYHYEPRQIIEFFDLTGYSQSFAPIPATKNHSSPGFFVAPSL